MPDHDTLQRLVCEALLNRLDVMDAPFSREYYHALADEHDEEFDDWCECDDCVPSQSSLNDDSISYDEDDGTYDE